MTLGSAMMEVFSGEYGKTGCRGKVIGKVMDEGLYQWCL